MSTPVVTFEPADFSRGHRHIDWDALRLFLSVSLPLLAFTVAMWWGFKQIEGRKDRSPINFIQNLWDWFEWRAR